MNKRKNLGFNPVRRIKKNKTTTKSDTASNLTREFECERHDGDVIDDEFFESSIKGVRDDMRLDRIDGMTGKLWM